MTGEESPYTKVDLAFYHKDIFIREVHPSLKEYNSELYLKPWKISLAARDNMGDPLDSCLAVPKNFISMTWIQKPDREDHESEKYWEKINYADL